MLRPAALAGSRIARLLYPLALVAILPAPAARSDETPPGSLASLPAVQAALADADAQMDHFVEQWVRIAEIPAPSGSEGRRADYLEARFKDLGLSDVGRDSAGNVVGLLKGRDPSLRRVALLAHMDTVSPQEADHTVRRPAAGRLQAPGIRDDSSGLAGLLAAVELIRRHGLVPPADTYVVATVREEIGLQGADQFVHERAGELGAVIALDGHLGQVSYGATGITWLKVHFKAEGAHTLKAYEKPNAIVAAARAIDRIQAIPLKRSPESMASWLNIGMMGGGDVPNAQARDAWFTVDLRSNDAATLASMESKVEEIARQSAREVGVEQEIETLHRMAGGTIRGFEDSELVRSARDVLRILHWDQVEITPRGTAEHNVAIVRGIPGIAIGLTTGDGAHTPGEYADVAPFAIGVKQVVLLALLPLVGGS